MVKPFPIFGLARHALFLAVTLFLTTAARATTFITDVKLIGGTKAECNSLKTSLTDEGWTVIDYDLNKGASGDYIFLLYKADNNTDGINRGYITDFYISSEGDVADDSHTVDGRTYNLASFAGGDHFKEKKGDLNSGTGHGSANIHLYYTKDLFPDYRAVTGITFNDTSTGAVVWNGSGNPADLNAGCGSETPYIYMNISTATAMTGHKPQSSLEAYSAGKYQIAVRGWAYDPDIIAQSITVQVKIYQNDGTTLYKTQNLTANQANANAGVSGNHGFAGTLTNIAAGTYKVKLFALDYNGDGDAQIGTTRTVTVTGSQPSGRIDACTGGVGQITLSGWAYDPDAASQSIGVQVKIYMQDGTTLYKTVDLTADRQRNDINNTYNITGQHGYSAAIDIADAGTYKVMVYAIDTNGDGNPQIGSTQTVNVTRGVTLTSETGEVILQDGYVLTGTGGANTHVTIAAGATVTFSGVNITSIAYDGNHQWAGITCLGYAAIILADGTTNIVNSGYSYYPGIQAGPSGTTLTIRGSGTLTATGLLSAAGIGGGFQINCGDIVIDGGNVTAIGDHNATGIGSGFSASCGNITITANVTSVTASHEGYYPPRYSIGAGDNGSCGTVTIGGVVTGSIETSPFTFTPADIVSVSFNANGGTGTMSSQTFINGVPISLNASTFSPSLKDYFCYGWNTKADGSGTSYSNRQSITINGNTTLYAQWKECRVIDLSLVHGNDGFFSSPAVVFEAIDGDIITGWSDGYVMVQIASGATITLRNAHINNIKKPVIHTFGDASIILEGYNYVKGDGIASGILNNNTLTISGNGALEVLGKPRETPPEDPWGNSETPSGGDNGYKDFSGAITGRVFFDGDFIDNSYDYDRRYTILSRNPHLPDDADYGAMIDIYNGQSGINVTLSGRTLYKDGTWNTLCLPFSMSAQQVASQLAPTKLMTLSSSTFSGGILTLNFEDATSIEAGKPYIIKWTSGQNITDPTFTGVTINNTTAPIETQLVKMIGTYKPFDSTTGLLLGSHNPDNGAFRAALSLGTPERGGLNFSGWYTDAKYNNPVTTIPFAQNGTVTLYAKFTDGTANVTLAKEGYSTYYNSLADAVLPAGMKARIITAKAGGQTLTYQTVADGDLSAAATNKVPAGTAVMLQVAPAAATQNINMTLTAPAVSGIGLDNLLHGSDIETTTTGGSQYYKLSYNRDGDNKTIGWYWGAQDAGAFTSGAHKAWLALPSNGQHAPVMGIGLPDFYEGTTDVTIIPYPTKQDDVWYDIYGRKLNGEPTAKGVYIHDGQTIMIK